MPSRGSHPQDLIEPSSPPKAPPPDTVTYEFGDTHTFKHSAHCTGVDPSMERAVHLSKCVVSPGNSGSNLVTWQSSFSTVW